MFIVKSSKECKSILTECVSQIHVNKFTLDENKNGKQNSIPNTPAKTVAIAAN